MATETFIYLHSPDFKMSLQNPAPLIQSVVFFTATELISCLILLSLEDCVNDWGCQEPRIRERAPVRLGVPLEYPSDESSLTNC